MDSEEDMENGMSSEESDDDIVEDLEEVKDKKRNHTHVKDTDEHEVGVRNKKLKLASEKEMKRLSKPATAEELNRLRETENLFHSNLFRLQIEEMLKEVQLKQKYKKEIQKWFEMFQSVVSKLGDGAVKRNLSDTHWLKLQKIKVPLPQLPLCGKGSYQFRKPINVDLVGSYTLETVVGPKVTVDIIVELPQKFYHQEDFINGTYHWKRALYLCDLVSHLQKHNEIVEVINFVSDGNDVLKPKIEIIPPGKLAKYVSMVLNVIVDKRGINLFRFNPNKNNVRMKWFFNQDDMDMEDTNYDSATPFYNSSILSDLTLLDDFKFMNSFVQQHKNIRDGVILLKIWLKQRELSSGLGDFSGYLVTMLVTYLLQIKKINSFMSSYQVVRTVFNYLVSSDWTKNGITLCKSTCDNNVPSIADFHEHHQVVFVDITGYYNLCYGMHYSVYQQIRHEAQAGLDALDNPDVNSFQILFMIPVSFYRSFDQVFVFHNHEALQNVIDIYGSTEDKLNYCGTLYPNLVKMMYGVLKKGFRERINCLCVRQMEKLRWKAQKKFRYSLQLTFGLNLNPEKYFMLVDKATESETAEFLEFWGELSQLRRFQDGTITEAVVWEGKLLSQKRLICKQIVTYLMNKKFGLNICDFLYIGDQFDCFIPNDIEESSMKVIDVFDRLSKELRKLKDLPLDIVSVQGASPVFRYTEIRPLTSRKFIIGSKHNERDVKKRGIYEIMDENTIVAPEFVNPIEIVVQMVATNKWPQDLGAIKRLRTAFYLKIAQSLMDQYQIKSIPFPDVLQLQKEGFVFHLRIVCPNEIGLLKQVIEDGIIKYRDNEYSMAVEKQTMLLPKLTSALHGLYEQHSSFGPACCMVKRWVNSQMIDPFHISEEVLEMLVAYLYLKPYPYKIPQQPQTAFFRFLKMMTETNWNSEHIVLNINNELNRDDLLDIESHFNEHRDSLPPVFIATPYDRTKSIWTIDSPTPVVLLRLVQLCGNVLKFIENRIYRKTELNNEFQTLFQPSLDSYNAVIHLNTNFVPRGRNMKNDGGEPVNFIPVNGFDPVTFYVKELREAYGDVALFFYDSYGGPDIGVVWKPGAEEPKDFKVGNMAMHTYNEKTKKLHLTRELIIEDFMIMGKGLVKSIDVIENGNIKSYTYL